MKPEKRIYIVGAHSRAQTLAAYIQYLYPETVIEAFLYDNEEQNPESITGIPVIALDSAELHTDYPVYIGTRGIYHNNITEHLRLLGFEKIYPVTVELDLRLRNAYMEKYFAKAGRKFIKIDDLEGLEKELSAAVYVAESAFDAPLQQHYDLAPYEKRIQAGAALTSKRLPDIRITDDTFENISERNRQFCELTVLYWIWKNADEDIVGLEHYRRHFILPPDWAARMRQNHVDVILPVPLYAAPSLEENYKRRHDPSDWDYMLEYLSQNCAPEYHKAADFFKGNLYSPCNMFIMQREVLDDLCKWLFPILFAVAEHGGEKESAYRNRYPGFLSERLITFFFEKHRDVYKVVYADKNFLF